MERNIQCISFHIGVDRGIPSTTPLFKEYIMAKQKDINYNQLASIKPVTDSQKTVFDTWKTGKNQFLFGCAGTGKTFISLYLAL